MSFVRNQNIVCIDELLSSSSSVPHFKKLLKQINDKNSKLIEVRTRNQSKNNDWFLFRRHTITASIAHTIFHASKKNNTSFKKFSLISKNQHFPSHIPAIVWGNDKEPIARETYQEYMQCLDNLHSTQTFGLKMDTHNPWFGCSVDGICTRGDQSRYIIEIKCPYSFRSDSLIDNGVDRLCYLKMGEDGKPLLKESHSYFFQIQVQMGIWNIPSARLVVWCPTDFIIINIDFNPEFFDNVKEMLRKYYFNSYVPYMLRK